MSVDVRAMLTALIAERRVLDEAITSLSALTNGHGTAQATSATARKQQRGRAHHSMSAEMKARMYARMAAASHKGEEAARLAAEFGLRLKTIQGTWSKWARFADATATVPETETASV